MQNRSFILRTALAVILFAAAAVLLFLFLLLPNGRGQADTDEPASSAVSSAGAEDSSGEVSSGAVITDPTLPKDDAARERVLSEFLSSLLPYGGGRTVLSLEEDGAALLLEKTLTGAGVVGDSYSAAAGGVDRALSPMLSLYGGTLLYTDGNGSRFLLDENSGEILCPLDGYEIAYLRSPANGDAPLFRKDGICYFYDAAAKTLTETNSVFDPLIYFDYNSRFGRSTLDLHRFKSEKTRYYGYRTAAGETVIDPDSEKKNAAGTEQTYRFTFAFPFNDNGLAVVQYRDNRLVLIDRTGTVAIDPDLYSYEYSTGTKALDLFRRPVVFDESQIGQLYFDHGYLRVTRRIVDRMEMSSILEEYDTLIAEDGSFLPLPGGYTLRAYSDGVALLEKDGYYGYYSAEGKWITEPFYTYALPFSGGIGVIGEKDGYVGAVDTTGKTVIPFVFDHIGAVSEDRVTAYSSVGGWVLLRLGEMPAD